MLRFSFSYHPKYSTFSSVFPILKLHLHYHLQIFNHPNNLYILRFHATTILYPQPALSTIPQYQHNKSLSIPIHPSRCLHSHSPPPHSNQPSLAEADTTVPTRMRKTRNPEPLSQAMVAMHARRPQALMTMTQEEADTIKSCIASFGFHLSQDSEAGDKSDICNPQNERRRGKGVDSVDSGHWTAAASGDEMRCHAMPCEGSERVVV